MPGKLVIFSSPSGAGKTTIVKHLLKQNFHLRFSVSATSREKRDGEVDGKDYFFLSPEQFQTNIKDGLFLEWEEVYEDILYGTLKSEVDTIRESGSHVIFDVDVKGGMNIKKVYGGDALSVFVKPPSLGALEDRLRGRGTENDAMLKKRLQRAEMEINYAKDFDVVIVNDGLEVALAEADDLVGDFLHPKAVSQ